MGFPVPYYMTGPATRPGAMQKYTRTQKALAKRKGQAPVPPSHPKAQPKPTVVAKFTAPVPKPKNPTVNNHKPAGSATKPPTTKPKPNANKGPKPGGNKPNGNKGGNKGGNKPGVNVGFNPKKMAQSLTNLAYDSDLAAIQQAIDENQGNMASALEDIKGWAHQVGAENARATQEQQDAWHAAGDESAANTANIAGLFGGAAGGEAGAYGNVGVDMINAIGASDQAFNERMTPILSAQFADYGRRATNDFNQQGRELRQQLVSTKKEKANAYNQNLMDVMDMAWGRKQDMLQYNLAKQAADQAAQMAGIQLQQGQQDIVQGAQQIQAGKLTNQANKVALQKSKVELQKLKQNPSGFDMTDPQSRTQVAQAAFNGALNPNTGAFRINPKVAWANALNALAVLGLQGDARAVAAVKAAFMYNLNLSHSHKKWGQYFFDKKGNLVYDPTRKFKK